MWEGLQVIRMPTELAARNIAASDNGMVFSGIEMPTFEAVISCNITGLVGGAAGNSNACWAYCQKHHGKGQWDGVFRH